MKQTLLGIAAVVLVVGLVACDNLLNDSGSSNNAASNNPRAVFGQVLVSAEDGDDPVPVQGATVEAWTGTTLLEGVETDSEGRFSFASAYDDDVSIVVSIEGNVSVEVHDPDFPLEPSEMMPLYAGAARTVSDTGSAGLNFTFVGPFTEETVDQDDILLAWNAVENGDDTPLMVANVFQLQVITASGVSGDVHLVRGIDASGTGSWNEGRGFTPLATFASRVFDGFGHTISNLSMNVPSEGEAGLFRMIDNATVQNLIMSDLELIEADGRTGGIAGEAVAATVENVSISGNLSSGSMQALGGIIGEADNDSTVSNTHFSGDVESLYTGSGSRVGGLVGRSSANITNSSATGSVAGYSAVGGLVGSQFGNTIANSTVNSEVISTRGGTQDIDTGGLVGRVVSEAIITNSHSEGTVTNNAGGRNIGGLVGILNGGSIIEHSSSQSIVSAADSTRVGGLVGFMGGSRGSTNENYVVVRYSEASGEVSGDQQVGGLVGRIEDGTEIISSSAGGPVTANSDGGALIGLFVYDVDLAAAISSRVVDSAATGELTVAGVSIDSNHPNYLIGGTEAD